MNNLKYNHKNYEAADVIITLENGAVYAADVEDGVYIMDVVNSFEKRIETIQIDAFTIFSDYTVNDFFEDFTVCPDCGELIYRYDDDVVEIDNTGEYYCSYCVNQNPHIIAVHCTCYNQYYRRYNDYDVYIDTRAYIPHGGDAYGYITAQDYPGGDVIYMSPEYAQRYDYTPCEDCGDWYHVDSLIWSDVEGYYYCDDCIENHCNTSAIHEYGYKPSPDFCGKSDNHRFYGVELECEYEYGTMDCTDLEKFENSYPVYLKSDSSLDGSSFELVTHPCTLEYHTDMWGKLMYHVNNVGDRVYHNSGLHIHVDRRAFGSDVISQDLNVAKTIILFNNLWDSYILPFSRREGRELHWCDNTKKYHDELIMDKLTSSRDKALAVNGLYNKSRYQSVNLTNKNTVEFRIFRSTGKSYRLLAAIEFVDCLISYVLTHSLLDCQNTKKWETVFNNTEYEYLDAYNEWLISSGRVEL